MVLRDFLVDVFHERGGPPLNRVFDPFPGHYVVASERSLSALGIWVRRSGEVLLVIPRLRSRFTHNPDRIILAPLLRTRLWFMCFGICRFGKKLSDSQAIRFNFRMEPCDCLLCFFPHSNKCNQW